MLARFRPAFERRLMSTEYEPAFDLDAALSQARRMTGRDDPGAHLGDNRAALAAERAHARDEAALAAEWRTPAPVKPAQKRDLQP